MYFGLISLFFGMPFSVAVCDSETQPDTQFVLAAAAGPVLCLPFCLILDSIRLH